MFFLVVFLNYFLIDIKTLLDPNRNLSLMALYLSMRFGAFVVQFLYPYCNMIVPYLSIKTKSDFLVSFRQP